MLWIVWRHRVLSRDTMAKAVGTNLLHESVDLADLVNGKLRNSGSDGGFRLNVGKGEYEFVATGGTGLGMTGG